MEREVKCFIEKHARSTVADFSYQDDPLYSNKWVRGRTDIKSTIPRSIGSVSRLSQHFEVLSGAFDYTVNGIRCPVVGHNEKAFIDKCRSDRKGTD